MCAFKSVQLEGRVRDVVSNGAAVIETREGVVFARGGLVGERVTVALEPSRGRVQRGRIVDVLEASPDRVALPCPYASRCGGCALMHAGDQAQRALRTGFLREALRKAGAPEDLVIHRTDSSEALGYRRRARLAFVQRGGARLGFRRELSREIVDVAACLVLSPPLAEALTRLRTTVLPHLHGEGEIRLSMGHADAVAVVIESPSPQPPEAYTAAASLVDGVAIAGVALYAAGVSKPALFGDAREWTRAVDGSALEGPIGGFSQAHAGINQALVARVAELARTEGARVLELYAGAGNFTVALAGGAASYTAVEQSPDAVRALRDNLRARGLSVKVVEADAAKALSGGSLDVVVLDPPRVGAPGVLAQLLARKPKRIVYVSCDPATLGRDLAETLRRGYAIAWAEAFEMFPQTADLESLVLLERGA